MSERLITALTRAAREPAGDYRRRLYAAAARKLVFAIVVLLAVALYLVIVGVPK